MSLSQVFDNHTSAAKQIKTKQNKKNKTKKQKNIGISISYQSNCHSEHGYQPRISHSVQP